MTSWVPRLAAGTACWFLALSACGDDGDPVAPADAGAGAADAAPADLIMAVIDGVPHRWDLASASVGDPTEMAADGWLRVVAENEAGDRLELEARNFTGAQTCTLIEQDEEGEVVGLVQIVYFDPLADDYWWASGYRPTSTCTIDLTQLAGQPGGRWTGTFSGALATDVDDLEPLTIEGEFSVIAPGQRLRRGSL